MYNDILEYIQEQRDTPENSIIEGLVRERFEAKRNQGLEKRKAKVLEASRMTEEPKLKFARLSQAQIESMQRLFPDSDLSHLGI